MDTNVQGPTLGFRSPNSIVSSIMASVWSWIGIVRNDGTNSIFGFEHVTGHSDGLHQIRKSNVFKSYLRMSCRGSGILKAQKCGYFGLGYITRVEISLFGCENPEMTQSSTEIPNTQSHWRVSSETHYHIPIWPIRSHMRILHRTEAKPAQQSRLSLLPSAQKQLRLTTFGLKNAYYWRRWPKQ